MNCSGTNAYRYGTMKDWVISMTIVLADGTIVKTRRRPRKSSAGYDLTKLMVGSEGTLGLVTEAVLKVTSAPANVHVVIANFPSTHSAVKAAVTLIGSGLLLDALELLDKQSMWAINKSGLSSRKWKESPTLFLKLSGLQLAVEAQLKIIREAAQANRCEDFEVSTRKADIDISWGARKKVGPSLMAMKKDESDLFLNADAAVPISSLADIIEETHKVIANAGFSGSTLGHVGDGKSFMPILNLGTRSLLTSHKGNYHTVIICPENRREEGEKILAWVQQRAVQLEGTITGEHGIGIKLRDGLVNEVGEKAVNMMRKVSGTFKSWIQAFGLAAYVHRSSFRWIHCKFSTQIKWYA